MLGNNNSLKFKERLEHLFEFIRQVFIEVYSLKV